MRNPSRLLLASLSLLVLSACGGGAGDGTSARKGTARDYTRTESDVTVLPNGSGWTATRTVTLGNDDAGASRAGVALRTVNGSVTSAAATVAGDYAIEVTLQASAPTAEQAQEALATMSVEHRDGTDPGALYLDTEVEFAQYQANNVNRSASIAATLPADLAYDLYQSSINGSASTAGLGGPQAQLFTTNGTVTLAGTWDDAAANSVNGSVSASGDIASLQASTMNGSVESSLSGTRDSVADLESSTGSIDAAVNRTVGSTFDLYGDTDVGSVTIVVAGTEPVGTPTSSSAHYRSPDYASGSPRVKIIGRTSTGSVTIHE
jgi:hypothetical protein